MAQNDVAEAVVHRDAELGICSVPAYEPSTRFDRFFVDEMVLVSPADLSLAQKKNAWSELATEALILPTWGTGNRLQIDDALTRSDTPRIWAIEVGRTSTAVELINSGLGVARVPRSTISKSFAETFVGRPLVWPRV